MRKHRKIIIIVLFGALGALISILQSLGLKGNAGKILYLLHPLATVVSTCTFFIADNMQHEKSKMELITRHTGIIIEIASYAVTCMIYAIIYIWQKEELSTGRKIANLLEIIIPPNIISLIILIYLIGLSVQ